MSEKNKHAENSNKHNAKSDVFTGTDQDINPVTYRPSPDQRLVLMQALQPGCDENSPCGEETYTSKKNAINPRRGSIRYNFDIVKRNYSANFDRRVSKSQSRKKTSKILRIVKFNQQAKQFLWNLRTSSNILKLESLSQYQQNFINNFLNANLLSKNNHTAILSWLPVFDTHSYILWTWDLLYLLLTLTAFFWFPFQVSFLYGIQMMIPDPIYIFCLVGDILMNLNRSKIQKGSVIKDRLEISKIYLDAFLFRDFFSFSALVVKQTTENHSLFVLLIIFYLVSRLGRVIEIVDDLIEFYDVQSYVRDLFSLFNMVLIVFTITHIIACIWHGISFYSNENVTWLKFYELDQTSIFHKYQVSFYWAAMTMTTVGYGDITPKNPIEYSFANLTMIIACMVFAYTMNRIGMLLNAINQRNAEFKKNMGLLNNYMSKHKVNYVLQSKIRSYLSYIQQLESEQNNQEIETIILKLSSALRSELNQQIKGSVIKKCGIFKGFSEQLLSAITTIIEEVRFAPEDIIVEKNKSDSNSLYMIQQGEVRYQYTNAYECKAKQEYQHIGQISFFTDEPQQITISSKQISNSYKIQRKKFLQLLQDHPKDKVFLNSIEGNISSNKGYDDLLIKLLLNKSALLMLSIRKAYNNLMLAASSQF